MDNSLSSSFRFVTCIYLEAKPLIASVATCIPSMETPSANCLNHDVLKIICNFLEQKELSVFSQTSKEWRSVALKPLYSRLYITERISKSTRGGIQGIRNCSIVSNSLNDSDCPLKKLDRSLGNSLFLCSLIEEIYIDDTVFVLFKLQGWIRRFFSSRHCNLRSVFYGNIPMSHFLIGYDSLCSVYLKASILRLLTTIQIRNIPDLIGICLYAHDLLQLRKLYFYLTDKFSIESTPFSEGVALAFSRITHLVIKSSSKCDLLFMKHLRDVYGPLVFPCLKSLSFSHYHRDLINPNYEGREFKLTLDDLIQTIDISCLEELNCKIGCSRIAVVQELEDEGHFETIYEREEDTCSCLVLFCERLSTSLMGSSVKKMCIERVGDPLVSNPYAIYHFKRHLATFLSKLRGNHKIRSLVLDLKTELLPPWRGHLDNPSLVKSMNYANTLFLQNVKGLELKRITIVDYFESFVVWKKNIMPGNVELMEFCANHCSQCERAYGSLKEFVSVNSKIQFYLDPTYNKGLSEFFYDIFYVLLSIKKNPMFAYVTHQESVKNGNRSHGRNLSFSQEDDYIPAPDRITQSLVQELLNGGFSLHALFCHDTYLDLVNSRGPQRGKRKTIPCSCRGDELMRFIDLLEHSSRIEYE